ncbi:MAG TPA: hypothetical protein PKE04_04545, partial [Clostridia bacterium]|nr:hypothetical protein [Clostridia bacterium]
MRWRVRALEPMPDRYTRIPPFAQYIGTYLAIVALMFAVLMPVSDRARQAAMQNYLSMRRYALETSAKALERQLDGFRRIPLTMQHSSYYLVMRLLDREGLQIRHYYALSRLQNLYRLQCNQLELPVNGFLLFMRNDTVVADERYYYEALDCFTKHLRYEDMGAGQMLALCKEITVQQTFLPMQAVSVDGGPGKPYLTYLYQNQEESALYGMLLPAEALSSLFQLSDLPAGSDFVMETLDGKVLYDANVSVQGGARQDLVEMRADIFTARCRVILSIPRSYFEDMIRPVTSLNTLYATGAVAVGILLSLLFSLVNLRPLRKLLRIAAPGSGDGR